MGGLGKNKLGSQRVVRRVPQSFFSCRVLKARGGVVPTVKKGLMGHFFPGTHMQWGGLVLMELGNL